MTTQKTKTKVELIHFLERMTAVSGVVMGVSLVTALTIVTCLPLTIDNECYAKIAATFGDSAFKVGLISIIARRILALSLPRYCTRTK